MYNLQLVVGCRSFRRAYANEMLNFSTKLEMTGSSMTRT